MRTPTAKTTLRALLATTATLLLLLPAAASAVTPNQLILASHYGKQVNATNDGDVCTIESKNTCQPGIESGEPGGFLDPGSVAVNKQGDLYVADDPNKRVQELSPAGAFISMFGWNVNKTKIEAGAPQAERDICTAASTDTCQAGEEGSGQAEDQGSPRDVAVDPITGNVYVLDGPYYRVSEYTEAGTFILTIGGEVNETKDNTPGATETEKNLCTAASKDTCKAGIQASPESTIRGAFNPEEGPGSLLAVGGPSDLLYVGDQGRVQVFKATGEWAGEISLAGLLASGYTAALAVDAAGDVFLVESPLGGVHEYDAAGQLQPTVIGPASPNAQVLALAIDPSGHLGTIEELPEHYEHHETIFGRFYGELYTTTGSKVSEFEPSIGGMAAPRGLAFAPASAPAPGEAYITEAALATHGPLAPPSTQEVEGYEPIVFAEMRTCAPAVAATSAVLCGEVNPNSLATSALFQYGTNSALGSSTPVAFTGSGGTFEPVHWTLEALEPNQTYDYQLAAQAPVHGEPLTEASEQRSFHTPVIPPLTPGSPSAPFIRTQSAVLSAQVNPEHAPTRYHFEYGACASLQACPTVLFTETEESSQYGAITATREIHGLAENTTYRYRLVANNEFEEEGQTLGGKATGEEGSFTTATIAHDLQAETGPASAITPTAATITGTVNPDGNPATYTFELGVNAGAATQYGIVLSAQVDGETTNVAESLQLSGLQPGTTYAYRIQVHSGYGEATGQTLTFTTPGLTSPLIPPTPSPLLATPPIAFPNPTVPASKHRTACKRRSTRAKTGACPKVRRKTKTKKHKQHKK
ncbi:MAG TPA: NHL repeat-containing protein [Solirubrobacteraceae bacterium]|jgi:DNA-binding beta-propeller fold protein YncE|nr:NHL repeat-containing protein [Solirubrobacteraceae bacterium]